MVDKGSLLPSFSTNQAWIFALPGGHLNLSLIIMAKKGYPRYLVF